MRIHSIRYLVEPRSGGRERGEVQTSLLAPAMWKVHFRNSLKERKSISLATEIDILIHLLNLPMPAWGPASSLATSFVPPSCRVGNSEFQEKEEL